LTLEESGLWCKAQDYLHQRKDIPIHLPAWFEQLVDPDLIPLFRDVRIRRIWPQFVEGVKTIALIGASRFTREHLGRRGMIEVDFGHFAIASLIFDRVIADTLTRGGPVEAVATANMIKNVQANAPQRETIGVGARELVKRFGLSRAKAGRMLRFAEDAGAIVRVGKAQKNNAKLYVPAASVGFIGDPENVYRRLRLTDPVQIVDPLTGTWRRYRRS
jgi:hypothetical protein